jgi:hypothetical protein
VKNTLGVKWSQVHSQRHVRRPQAQGIILTNVRRDATHAQLQNPALVRENGSSVGPAGTRKNLLRESAKASAANFAMTGHNER